jgi:hypothetical protein
MRSLKERSCSARRGAVLNPSRACRRSESFTVSVDDSPGLKASESFLIEPVLRKRLNALGLDRLPDVLFDGAAELVVSLGAESTYLFNCSSDRDGAATGFLVVDLSSLDSV